MTHWTFTVITDSATRRGRGGGVAEEETVASW